MNNELFSAPSFKGSLQDLQVCNAYWSNIARLIQGIEEEISCPDNKAVLMAWILGVVSQPVMAPPESSYEYDKEFQALLAVAGVPHKDNYVR